MLESVAIAPLNHLLRRESWARKRLQSYAGKTARLRLPPFPTLSLPYKPAASYLLQRVTAATMLSLYSPPDCCRVCLPVTKLAYQEISIFGDRDFAEEIIQSGAICLGM